MNLLVCPNTTIIGGASLVALDLASAMRERGHDVTFLGPPGDLIDRLGPVGIDWVEGPDTDDGSNPERSRQRTSWPSVTVMRLVHRVVRERAIDVVHAYEWTRALEVGWDAHLVTGVPLVASVLAVLGPKYIPRSAHVVVGADNLAVQYRQLGYANVHLLLPRLDRIPDATAEERDHFATTYALDGTLPTVVAASRLAAEKMDSLRYLIDAVGVLEPSRPVRLLIAGEGAGAAELRARADAVNARVGRPAIQFTGLLANVAPAYAAADVVVGMGTAALGGMAFGKPTVVVGQDGFAELLKPETVTSLESVGFWGVGSPGGAAERLAARIDEALDDPARTAQLAQLALDVVGRRPTKEQTDAAIEAVYQAAIDGRPSVITRAASTARSATRFTAMRARAIATRWWRQRRSPETRSSVV